MGDIMKQRLKRHILHIFFPNRCPVCGEIIGAMERFCAGCKDGLTPFTGDFHLDGALSFTACFDYDEHIKPAVFLLKNGIAGNAAYALGGELADKLIAEGVAEDIDVIVPAPMYKSDLWRRGFNQAYLIAKELGAQLHLPVSPHALTKPCRTAPQKDLDKHSRSINLRNAFAIGSDDIKGKRVLLVDDICTTGATLRELTAVLNKNGAASVRCACCCKTRLHEPQS